MMILMEIVVELQNVKLLLHIYILYNITKISHIIQFVKLKCQNKTLKVASFVYIYI